MKTKCCERNAIANIDHKKSGPSGWNHPVKVTNRMCLNCGKQQTITSGYHDTYYHTKVIPGKYCQACGKNRAGEMKPESIL